MKKSTLTAVRYTAAGGLFCLLTLTTGCGSTTASLSGSISASASATLKRATASLMDFGKMAAKLQTSSLATISCISATVPPITKTGTIASNGTFTVDLKDVSGQPVTCTVLTATGTVVGTFTFQTATQTDIGGNKLSQDTVAITGGTNVGTVIVDQRSGSVNVDVDTLGLSTGAATLTAAEAFDFSGSWTVGAPSFTVPTGYVGPCAVDDNACNGPKTTAKLYIVRLEGTDFTPDAACNAAVTGDTFTTGSTCTGTTSTKTKFGVQVWQTNPGQSNNPVTSCGNKLGFTFDQAKAYAHVDLTGQSTVTSGAFAWTTPLPNGHVLVNGWEDQSGVSSYAINNCQNTTLSDGTNAWKCIDGVNGTYQLNIGGGGCVDSNNNQVHISDWSGVSFGGCTNTTTTHGSLSFQKSACTSTYNAATITCTGESAMFNVADNSAVPQNQWNAKFNYNNTNLVAQGALCSSIGGGNLLQQYQCYSQAYYAIQQLYGQDSSVCLRDVRMNWGASNANDFLIHNGPDQPTSQFATELLQYTGTDTAHFTHVQNDQRGVQINNGYAPCQMQTTISVTLKKIDATHVLVKFRQEQHLTDTQGICEANASSLGDGQAMRGMFELTKN